MSPPPAKRGRRRGHNPHIPAHIDQAKLPDGVYYDHRGRGNWYTLYQDGDRRRRKNIATARATLAELHRLAEDLTQVDRHKLRWLSQQFQGSDQFKRLARKTRGGYEYAAEVLLAQPTRVGTFGELTTRKITSAVVQRLIDRIAGEGTPSKANTVLRYLSRLFRWGKNRGYCDDNPAHGVEPAKERSQRRLPETVVMSRLIARARERGNDYPKRGQAGSCPTYLWIVMEIAYLCRLRGIEVVTLTDAHITERGLRTNRRKGSRDNIVGWTPRLRAAVTAAQDRRATIWERRGRALPMLPDRRPLIVSRNGDALRKTGFDSAWQRFIRLALAEETLTADERFALHDLKRKGITDYKGTRHDKQDASGHRSPGMMDVYDLSVPLVRASEE
ncbi:integrase [Billgrantia azerbaijanica]|nr:integrase [Halomonas azerbaijanica]